VLNDTNGSRDIFVRDRHTLGAGGWRDRKRGGGREGNYILIANTGMADGSATVTLLVEGGDPVVTQLPLKAQSRTNVPVSGLFPAGTNVKFGAIIESNGVLIVVERSMYTSAGGVTWTAGTAAVATKLQ
jgi:hypothetical protein